MYPCGGNKLFSFLKSYPLLKATPLEPVSMKAGCIVYHFIIHRVTLVDFSFIPAVN